MGTANGAMFLSRGVSSGGVADSKGMVKVSDLVKADARSHDNGNQVPIPKQSVKRD